MTLIPALLDQNRDAVSVSPPQTFRPLGDFNHVQIAGCLKSGYAIGRTSAQRRGLKYEAKVQKWLKKQLGPEYMVQPRLEVLGRSYLLRLLLPDGLLMLSDVATIIEIKSQHMPESYWQLRHLYEPAVRALPRICHVNCLTVVKSYDPAMPYPEEIERVFDIQDWVLREHSKIGVLRWQ